ELGLYVRISRVIRFDQDRDAVVVEQVAIGHNYSTSSSASTSAGSVIRGATLTRFRAVLLRNSGDRYVCSGIVGVKSAGKYRPNANGTGRSASPKWSSSLRSS